MTRQDDWLRQEDSILVAERRRDEFATRAPWNARAIVAELYPDLVAESLLTDTQKLAIEIEVIENQLVELKSEQALLEL